MNLQLGWLQGFKRMLTALQKKKHCKKRKRKREKQRVDQAPNQTGAKQTLSI
jgi:hypothetical protein